MKSALFCGAIFASLIANCLAGDFVVDDAAAREVALQWIRVVDSGDYRKAAGQTKPEVREIEHWMKYLKDDKTAQSLPFLLKSDYVNHC